MTHHHPVRVYYEDTDAGGVVYYAGYLRFIERGRSELLRALGVDQPRLLAEGTGFVVRRLAADWRAPARLDDLLDVETDVLRAGGARVEMAQRVLRGGALLMAAEVTLAAVGPGGRAARLPAGIRAALADLAGETPCA